MKEVQEHLVRAGAIARLEAILFELEQGSPRLTDPHRGWLAELLHPFNESRLGSCSLRPSPDVTGIEAGAILSVLLDDNLVDQDKLEQQVAEFIALRRALVADNNLTTAEATTARELAKRLRIHFVSDAMPAVPGIDSFC